MVFFNRLLPFRGAAMYRPVCASLFLLLPIAHADAPVALFLFPAGGQRGKSVDVRVGGLNLTATCRFEMVASGVEAPKHVRRVDSPWFEGPILPLPESQRQEDYPRTMAAQVKIAPDAVPGDRLVFLSTAQGVTTPLKFVVGDLPEITEQERDGRPIPAAVQHPLTINGRIFPRQDVDVWTITARAGEIITIRVDADRIGSPLEAKIDVRGPRGQVAEALATSGHDPRASFVASDAGTYAISIGDVRGDGGPAFVYRLSITSGPVVDRVFPLGGQRGKSVQLDVAGMGQPPRMTMSIPATGTLESPVPLDVDDLPELVEGPDAKLTVPAIGNGRIGVAGEVDRWRITGTKGQPVELELRAARLGSPLLGVIGIEDAGGKELMRAEAGTGNTIDPSLRFVPPADGTYIITVRDRFARRAGPEFAYRLRVTSPLPDFAATFASPSHTVTRDKLLNFKINLRRIGGFNRAIVVVAENLPAGVTCVPVVAGPGQVATDLPFKVAADAKIDVSRIRIRAVAMNGRGGLSEVMRLTSRYATWIDDASINEVRLSTAVATPFKIAGDYELKLIPRGTVYSRKYRIERNGFTGPIEISLADRQARHLQGVTGPTFVVPGEKSEFDYPITLPPWMETGRTCRVCVMGTATIKDADGTEHVVTYSSREQNDQVIAVVEPERLGLRIERPTVLIEPSGKAELKVEVRRGEGVSGTAKVELILPAGTTGITADAVQVNDESGTLIVRFAGNVRGPFTRSAIVKATVIVDGQPVTAERTLELVER